MKTVSLADVKELVAKIPGVEYMGCGELNNPDKFKYAFLYAKNGAQRRVKFNSSNPLNSAYKIALKLASEFPKETGVSICRRCDGTGKYPFHTLVANRICFQCFGNGYKVKSNLNH